MIDLQKFCAKDRDNISKPWSRDGFTYATNGHIMIRVPRIDDVPENPIAPAQEKIDRVLTFPDSPPFDIPDLPEEESSLCLACSGTGRVSMCPECDGEGVVTWRTLRHEYEADCQECDGYGTAPGDKEQCEKCGGEGKISKRIEITIGLALYDRKYLAILKELPGIKIYPRDDYQPHRFTFDGGDGALMPMIQR